MSLIVLTEGKGSPPTYLSTVVERRMGDWNGPIRKVCEIAYKKVQ